MASSDLGVTATADAVWTVSRAARQVGVSVPTLRSWEDRYGLGPSARTPGGHRRYTAAEIAGLQRVRRLVEGGMPTAAAAGQVQQRAVPPRAATNGARAETGGDDELARRFGHAAAALDGVELARVTRSLLSDRGTIAAWTQVFAPHLQQLGLRWAATGSGVHTEHLSAAVLQTVLTQHAWQHRRAHSHARVLLVATEDEQHTLPLHAACAALAEAGITSTVLGTLPGAAVHDAIVELAPSTVALWARSRHTRDQRLLRSLHGEVSVVCAAGPGWLPAHAPQPGAHLTDLAGATEFLTAWSSH